MESLINNMLFGVVISLIAFELALLIRKKTGIVLLNPLLVSIVMVIAFLLLFNIDVEIYNVGGDFINMFLGPATVVLAVPLYNQLDNLKRYAVPIVVGIFLGTVIGVISIIISCIIFDLNGEIISSLLPKSVTTPIGIEISSQLGGIIPITVLAILITGIIGAVIAPIVCKVFKIKNEVAIGVAIGTSSHAWGTTKALEMGEIEGAMSSLSIGVAGIMTVFIAPATYQLFINLIT